MAKRNMRKIIDETEFKVPNEYDMKSSELVELADRAKENPCKAVNDAFLYGYAMGRRAFKEEQNKKPCGHANVQQGKPLNSTNYEI